MPNVIVRLDLIAHAAISRATTSPMMFAASMRHLHGYARGDFERDREIDAHEQRSQMTARAIDAYRGEPPL